MTLSEALKKAGEKIWGEIHAHPFVRGIADGSLPEEAFRFYMGQDYVFLIEYARVLALAVSKGGGLETMGRFARLLDATLNQEMELHRKYAARFGLTAADLEAVELAPAARAYTRHLLEVAHSGGLAEIAVSLMPCQWGYAEIGSRLAREGVVSDANPYAEWIRTYASEEFRSIAGWLCGLIDRLGEGEEGGEEEGGAGLPASSRRELERIFLLSSRYEYLFWEMSYRQETWPV
ncbi:MAG: thiaminase II [Nitrospinota bacterium]